MFRSYSTIALLHMSFAIIGIAFAATPTPISLDFGHKFFGTDGSWSAAQIRVGSPAQYLSVLPNTVSSQFWAVAPGGCDSHERCLQLRGGLFNSSASGSYTSLGRYELGYTSSLDGQDYGDYGLDTVTIPGSVSTPNQVIASVNDTHVWLGELGLGAQETQFQDSIKHNSFIASLVSNVSAIPSHSYGYTAGAYYANKNLPGSLVLGGMDTTRFSPTNVSFNLSSDYMPILAVQNITVSSSRSQALSTFPSNWNSNPLPLMQSSQAALFTIDSSTPFLWMPPDVCDAFANALNLTYNSTMQVYLFPNNTISSTSNPGTLQNWNLTFTFNLANSVHSAYSVQIPISYSAFNLQLSYGFPGYNIGDGDPNLNYFPLRRANSSSMYAIGRAFLQESYLIVDYERNNFSISPAKFPDLSADYPNIVSISRPVDSRWAGPQSDIYTSTSTLSTGAKAGIAVGIVVVVISLIVLAFIIWRRKKAQPDDEKATGKKRRWFSRAANSPASPDTPVAELLADRRHPRELLVDSSNTRFELAGNDPVEMDAGQVSSTYLAQNRAADGSPIINNDPTHDVEPGFTDQSSVRKDYNIRTTTTERAASPAPPYSPSDVGRTNNTDSNTNTSSGSGGISPYDSRFSNGYGSQGSSGAAISPIAQYGTQTHSDEANSPVSPQTRHTQTMSSFQNSSSSGSGTQESSRSAALAVPSDLVSRTASRNSRFREELVDDDDSQRVSETQEEQPQLRPRFSWEQ